MVENTQSDKPKRKILPESIIRAKPFLIKAIVGNDTTVMQRIFKASFPIDEPIQGNSTTTAFMHCAAVGFQEGLELILSFNPNVKATDKSGRTALHLCCKNGNVNNLRFLLEKGVFDEIID